MPHGVSPWGWKYTGELLREAVAKSVSYAGVLRYLGVVQAGGNHAHISQRAARQVQDELGCLPDSG